MLWKKNTHIRILTLPGVSRRLRNVSKLVTATRKSRDNVQARWRAAGGHERMSELVSLPTATATSHARCTSASGSGKV